MTTADSDTGFGRDNNPVGVEKDDVGSVVKGFSKCAGCTYVQAPQQDKRHTAVDVECGVEKDHVGSVVKKSQTCAVSSTYKYHSISITEFDSDGQGSIVMLMYRTCYFWHVPNHESKPTAISSSNLQFYEAVFAL